MRKTYLSTTLLRATLILAFAAGIIYPTQADELYAVSWRGTKYSSVDGKIVSQPFTERMYVRKVAQDYGLDANDLVLVYRPDKRDLTMVRRSTGAFVASIIQMEYVYTDVGNATGTATVRQVFLFDEYHDSALGTAAGTERLHRNANGGLTSYTFAGRFNYTDEGAVYIGSFTTGGKIQDRTGS